MLQDSIAILHFLSDLPIIRVDSNEIVDCELFFKSFTIFVSRLQMYNYWNVSDNISVLTSSTNITYRQSVF